MEVEAVGPKAHHVHLASVGVRVSGGVPGPDRPLVPARELSGALDGQFFRDALKRALDNVFVKRLS